MAAEGLSDEALLAGLTFADPETGRAFVQRFQGRVFGLALAILKNPVLAEDIAQEAFLRAWKHGPSYDPRRGTVTGWLLRITRNLAIDALRLRRAEVMDPDVLTALAPPADVNVEDTALTREAADAVRRALRNLPEEQRRALLLAAFYGRTDDDDGGAGSKQRAMTAAATRPARMTPVARTGSGEKLDARIRTTPTGTA